MPTATKTSVVTKAELLELAEWEQEYALATKKVADAKKELDFRRVQVAEKVLGIKSSEELKTLSPDQVERRIAKRLEAGDWRPQANAPEFAFVETSHGSYPAWSKLFIEKLGESAANKIRTETPVNYSYSVQVTLP
jgi:hypothetical protein